MGKRGRHDASPREDDLPEVAELLHACQAPWTQGDWLKMLEKLDIDKLNGMLSVLNEKGQISRTHSELAINIPMSEKVYTLFERLKAVKETTDKAFLRAIMENFSTSGGSFDRQALIGAIKVVKTAKERPNPPTVTNGLFGVAPSSMNSAESSTRATSPFGPAPREDDQLRIATTIRDKSFEEDRWEWMQEQIGKHDKNQDTKHGDKESDDEDL